MGILQKNHNHLRWSNNQEISPEFPPESGSSSSENSLSSISSLTLKQPSITQKHQYVTTLKAHTSSISCLTLAGKHLLSGSSDHQVRVWPRDSLPTVQNLFDCSESAVKSIVVSGEKLFTGHQSGESAVKSMVVSGEKLFTSHQDHKIRVWKIDHDDDSDIHYRKMMKSTYLATLPTLNNRVSKMFSAKINVKNHTDAVTALALSHDGSFLYSGSSDRTFKVWRTSDFKCLESVSNAHDESINAIIVSHDGYVYTGSADRKIKVWWKPAGEKKHRLIDTLEKHKSAVNTLALSSDGSVLYSGACDRSILVWEKGHGGESGGDGRHMVVAGALRGHSMSVLCITVVGDLVVSGSADKTVRIWRGVGGKKYSRVCMMEGHNGPVKCLTGAVDSCTSADSSGTSYLVYSGSSDCDVKVWKVWVPFVSFS